MHKAHFAIAKKTTNTQLRGRKKETIRNDHRASHVAAPCTMLLPIQLSSSLVPILFVLIKKVKTIYWISVSINIRNSEVNTQII